MTDEVGDNWFFYHAWMGDIHLYPPGRVVGLDKIVWGQDDWPDIGVPSRDPVPRPVTNAAPRIQVVSNTTTDGAEYIGPSADFLVQNQHVQLAVCNLIEMNPLPIWALDGGVQGITGLFV